MLNAYFQWVGNNICIGFPLTIIIGYILIVIVYALLHDGLNWLSFERRNLKHKAYDRANEPKGWKGEVNKYLKKEDQRKRQQEEEERERSERDYNFRRGKEAFERKQEYQRKLDELGRKFRCNYCNKPSVVPKQRWIGQSAIIASFGGDGQDTSYQNYEQIYDDDWSSPGDLNICPHCKNLFCNDHFYKNYCIRYWQERNNP